MAKKPHEDAEVLIESLYEKIFEDGEACRTCPHHRTWEEPFPFDVEKRLQKIETFRECEATAETCPEVSFLIQEAASLMET